MDPWVHSALKPAIRRNTALRNLQRFRRPRRVQIPLLALYRRKSSAISSDRSLIGSPSSRPPVSLRSRIASMLSRSRWLKTSVVDSDLFGEGSRDPEAERRFQAALKRGFQTRNAEVDLAGLLGDLADD